MVCYACFGLAVDSEIELPNLPPADRAPEFVIRLGRAPGIARATMNEEVVHHLRAAHALSPGGSESGPPAPTSGGKNDGFSAAAARLVTASRERRRNRRRGVLFLGASGTGKSTIAAAFHRQGRRVVTDDVGAIRRATGSRYLMCRGGSRIRLKNDSRRPGDHCG
jgi:hypothetical protein